MKTSGGLTCKWAAPWGGSGGPGTGPAPSARTGSSPGPRSGGDPGKGAAVKLQDLQRKESKGGEGDGGGPTGWGTVGQAHLQPVSTGGGHGPILGNDTQGAQAVAGPQLGVSRAVRWSHLHCPWGSRAREHGSRPGVGFPSWPCLPEDSTRAPRPSAPRSPPPAAGSLLLTALTRAHVRLDSRVRDEGEKLPCQGVTKVSPMQMLKGGRGKDRHT